MFWIGLLLFIGLIVYPAWQLWSRPDPMANLLDELDARDALGRLLAVPRYEQIVREILAVKDGDR